MIRLLTAASALLATAGCATAVAPLPAVLDYAGSGCAPRVDLGGAISLTPAKETNGFVVVADVGGGSPCLIGAGGKATPYALFALPADPDDKTIAVGGALEPLRIFSPQVSVLAADGTELRTLPAADFFYRGPVFSVQFRPREGEAFLLVGADPARVGQRYDAINVGTNTTTVYTGFGAANFTTGVEANNSRLFSYHGGVQVIVYDTDLEDGKQAR
ncbi:MAG TPA: hypothetical protein VGB60_00705 [Brevundimonas sp.]|jgi:hypothetical protein|uniref:hypothetical protein n=1 Tax=Brevundimonas sp. TaxID=1871086 RepID=UPI002ED80A55